MPVPVGQVAGESRWQSEHVRLQTPQPEAGNGAGLGGVTLPSLARLFLSNSAVLAITLGVLLNGLLRAFLPERAEAGR